MNSDQIDNMLKLFDAVREGTVTDEQRSELDMLLSKDKKACKYYIEYLNMCTLLKNGKAIEDRTQHAAAVDDAILDVGIWDNFASYEKTAPAVTLPEQTPQRELIQKVIYPVREKRKMSAISIVFFAMNAAAVLFIILFLKFAPSKVSVEVATLTDSINAKWADVNASMQKGTRLDVNSDKLMLREGVAELTFDDHAKAIIEAPAEFQILAEDRIGLTYGKVYAIVPPGAIGFSVYTPNAKVIDLGTEFGVQADTGGDTKLFVYKGKTSLIAVGESDGISMEVTKDVAKQVSGVTARISDITFGQKLFVREINSKTNTVWRGENVGLASIVAGLDGFRQIGSLTGLDPVKADFATSVSESYQVSNNAYNPVPGSKYIDGVFVPDGESGAIQVTSMGHTFACPDTSGVFTHRIAAYNSPFRDRETAISPKVIFNNNGQFLKDPVLTLHSNAGITFDLQAIRESLPQMNLRCLKGTGVPIKEYDSDVDFYVLVDGQVKYERKTGESSTDRDAVAFSVELDPADRFLTLIVTEGSSGSFANDFFYLINPELILQ